MNKLISTILIFFLLFSGITNSIFASTIKNPDSNYLKTKAHSWLNQSKQLGFEENKGQLSGTDGKKADFVLFKAEALGLTIWITTTGLTYQFLKFEENKKEARYEMLDSRDSKNQEPRVEESSELSWHRVDMILKNATIKKENIITENELTPSKLDYYLGHCPTGVFNVKTFSKITIANIYEGIDWILYTHNGAKGSTIKQDFVVHPNANPDQLKLIYEGSGKFNVTNNQIHFQNQLGELHEGTLLCYQENASNEISSKYVAQKKSTLLNGAAGNFLNQLPTKNDELPNTNFFSYEVTIKTDNYNKKKTLIIDPELVWGTFLGGNAPTDISAIDIDKNGNLFVVGASNAVNFPVVNTGTFFQGVSNGITNIYISKFNNTGTLLWSTYYGGDNEDRVNDIKSDINGNIYITGYTNSTFFPVQSAGTFFEGSYLGGIFDAYILKFDNLGSRLWATYIAGSDLDVGNAIATDNTGNIFLVGHTTSLDIPISNPGGGAYYQNTNQGIIDAFILKFDNLGNLQWGTYYGGSIDDIAKSVEVDNNGNVYVVGSTTSVDFPTQNSGSFFQASNTGADDAMIIKFNNLGVRLWATYYGGSLPDIAYCVVTDNSGNVFILGKTASTNFPLQNAGTFFQAVYGGGLSDAFIIKFDNAGNRLWSTYYGGADYETFEIGSTNLAVDSCGRLYATFDTFSNNITTKQPCDPTGYFKSTLMTTRDNFIICFSNAGNLIWASYSGGNTVDFNSCIALDAADNLFIGSWWAGINGNTYPLMNYAGSYFDNFYNGNAKGFIFKLIPPTLRLTTSSTPASCGCNGSASVTATGACPPYVYTWYTSNWTVISNTQNVSNLCAGNYQVIVTDTNSCSLKDTSFVTITSNNLPITNTQNFSICNGDTITVGATNYSNSGTFTDTLTTVNNCDSIVTTNITIKPNTTFTQSISICNGDSLSVGSNTYYTSGTYTDTLAAFNTCDSIITSTITVSTAIFLTNNAAICNGDSITIGLSTYYTAGTYIDTIAMPSSCDSIITNIITVKPIITFSQSFAICNGDSLSVGPNTYYTSGTYTDTLAAVNSCDSIITSAITISPGIPISNNFFICNGDSVTIGSSTYFSPGTYIDTIIVANSCDTIITTNISITPNSSFTQNFSICNGDSINVGTNNYYTSGTYTDTLTSINSCDSILTTNLVVLQNASSTQNISVCSHQGYVLLNGTLVTSSGMYTDTLNSFTNCDSILTTNLTVNTSPTADVSPDVTISTGSSTTLIASGGGSYIWYPANGLSTTSNDTVIANPMQTTTYCVIVTNLNNCADTACVKVTVEFGCPSNNEKFTLPNAFSPNNDGQNDEFCLQGWENCVKNFEINIFNRWGEKVYESENPGFCWNGTFKNNIMDTQVFVYYIKAINTSNNTKIVRKGNISLIR